MHSDWQRFLTDNGALFSGNRTEHFGALSDELRATGSATVVCDLSHYALWEIAGADAADFLQGQLTNDIRQLQSERSQLSAYCDHKGRVLALFRLWPWQDGFRATLPAEIAEETIKRLRMFVLRSQVEIRDKSDETVGIGLAGPRAMELIEREIGPAPGKPNQYRDHDATRVTRLPGEHPRYEIHVPVAAAIALWKALGADATAVGAPCWDLLTVRAVQPEVLSATRSLFTPQMLNLEVLDGVSFNKGCYTGQEVVARTQFLGTIKRRMFPGTVKDGDLPAPGTELIGAESGSGQAAGRIVLSAPSPEGGYEVLSMAQISARDQGPMHLQGAPEAVVELGNTPYSLEQVKPGSR